MSPEEVVRTFCKAVERCDVKELAGFFTDDAVYHNIPLAPVRGRAEIESTLAQFLSPGARCEFEIKGLAATGNVVLTERVDRFEMGGKKIALPVMGAFEVTPAGKISAWRDYFDMQQFTSQMA
ncbi:MAG TPA: limonene-1,2-epoxide hydrolase family protein [Candidatus Binatia bacterium]|nr:limonene-1,2-epoxide hydrolase family protein [Candidatus Binatia bacterium]